MHWIDEQTVEEIWQEVAELDVDEASQQMLEFGMQQPGLLSFVMVVAEEMDEEVQELAIYLLFVIYRMFQHAYERDLPSIAPEAIMAAHEKNEELMGSLDGGDEPAMVLTALKQTGSQPWVMTYLVEVLVEAPEGDDPVDLSEEDFGELFLLLKTAIDVLNEATDA